MGPRLSGLRDIVEALADQIRTTVTDTDFPVQVEPQYVIVPTPLTIDIYPGDPARDADTAGFDEISGAYVLTIRARINTPDFDAAYDVLLSLMDDSDPLSLAAAVFDDPTLGGFASSTDVRDFTGLRAYETPDGTAGYLGFQVTALAIPALS